MLFIFVWIGRFCFGGFGVEHSQIHFNEGCESQIVIRNPTMKERADKASTISSEKDQHVETACNTMENSSEAMNAINNATSKNNSLPH